MGPSSRTVCDRVRASNAASLLYTLPETKIPVEISLILVQGEEIFCPPSLSAAAEFRISQSEIRHIKIWSCVCLSLPYAHNRIFTP